MNAIASIVHEISNPSLWIPHNGERTTKTNLHFYRQSNKDNKRTMPKCKK